MTENQAKNHIATPVAPLADFDWSSGSGKYGSYSSDERQRMESMYNVSLTNVQSNEVVKAVVAGISDRDVILNIGFKSDGMVPRSAICPTFPLGTKWKFLLLIVKTATVIFCCPAKLPGL